MAVAPCFQAALSLSNSPATFGIRYTHRRSRVRPTSRRTCSMTAPGPDDLLVIGAGHLGRMIGAQWRQAYPSATIIGETRSEAAHDLIRSAGITPALAGSSAKTYPHVVFCAPPTAFRDDKGGSQYPAAATAAAARVVTGGRVVITSSGSVHGPAAKFICEATPVDDTGRAGVLAEAERRILAVPEGRVVRLAGLYLVDRGAHTFWLRRGSVTGSPDAMVNLVYYGDAARAVVRVLQRAPAVEGAEREGGRVFLVAAEQSISRRRICEVALSHPMFEGFEPPVYGDDSPGELKRYDGSWTRKALGWMPEFESFADFMEADAKRCPGAASAGV